MDEGALVAGRPHLTFIDMLTKDIILRSVDEIQTVMLLWFDRDVWRGVVTARTKKQT